MTTTSARALDEREPAAGGRQAPDGGEAATVMARVRAELVELHATVLDLQAALGPALAAAASDRSVAGAAQRLDLVAQTLDGLSTFLGDLAVPAQGSGALAVEAAAARVGMGALASRLAGRPCPTPDGFGHGEVELF